MKVCIDIEANGLENPTKIWLVCCKDIDTGVYYAWRNLSTDGEARESFLKFAQGVQLWVGHNFLGYDYPVLNVLLGVVVSDLARRSCDTLIISKLVDYPRDGHSIEDYGIEFGIPKGDFHDFSKYSAEMETYCIRDVDICHRIYTKYIRYIRNPERHRAILLEHEFQLVVNDLHNNGFGFNTDKANKLLAKVTEELTKLDQKILEAFPPKQVLVRTFTPKETKFGTINRTSVPRKLHDKIHEFEVGKVYPLYVEQTFNPASHKQIVDVLHEAGWSPVDRTTTAITNQRELNKLKRQRFKDFTVDIRIKELYTKGQSQEKYGWKINENNLLTLPANAPPAARTLASRILYESRRRTLSEWLGLVTSDGRIHGKFYGLGAWTHRMAHQAPNTANIPNATDLSGKVKLLGAEMRSLWCAPKGRLLVGVDAEGIQLRIFAHYINDPEFTDALVKGSKHDKSDPHSLNQRILGDCCKSRSAAKRFVFALLLGAGLGKLSQILECSQSECQQALDRLLVRYTGFARLKSETIPSDAKRGWFLGLDGRAVRIPGETQSERSHLCMSGYLQNGEAVVMKHATIKWYNALKDIKDWKLVNFVHDEWQTECPNNMDIALKIAQAQCDALREVGEELGLRCPLAGSYYNEDIKDYTIATNWKLTH